MTLGIGLLDTRLADLCDLDDLMAMHARCSPESLYQRYLTAGRGPGPRVLARLMDPKYAQTFLVTEATAVIAAGNLARDGDSVEAALLVEDSWQRRGVGTALFSFLLRTAAGAGYSSVLLHTHAGNLGVRRMIHRAAAQGTGPDLWPAHMDGPLLTYLLPLSPFSG
jgi:GNAT superfamily N-acetyltransferase